MTKIACEECTHKWADKHDVSIPDAPKEVRASTDRARLRTTSRRQPTPTNNRKRLGFAKAMLPRRRGLRRPSG